MVEQIQVIAKKVFCTICETNQTGGNNDGSTGIESLG